MVKNRNIVLVYLWSFLTLGIYSIVWLVKTKGEINSLGAKIPTSWLLIVPIANLYWLYRYSEGFSLYVKKDDKTVLWFILWLIPYVDVVMPGITQAGLNKLA